MDSFWTENGPYQVKIMNNYMSSKYLVWSMLPLQSDHSLHKTKCGLLLFNKYCTWIVKTLISGFDQSSHVSWSTSDLRARWALWNWFKPSSNIFYWPFQGGTSFVDLLCFCSVLCLLCLCTRASVYMCFVVTCWERADLLALVYGV